MPVHRAKAGQPREAAQQLRWWPPGLAPHNQSLAQLRYRLTSRGQRDRKYLLFSLPLQVQPPNVQLKLLHTNSQTIPLMVHKPLANGSPARVLALLQQAAKTILINLAAGPPIHGKRSLDFIGLPGLILRLQRAMRASLCTTTQEMTAHQSQNMTILLANRYY